MIKPKYITTKKAGALFVLFSLIITGCRQPIADFDVDKEEYSAGSIVHVTNKSSHGKSYQWHFYSDQYNPHAQPDSKEINPNDTINMMAEDGIHHIRMTAYSKGKRKTDIVEKSFLVKTMRGTLDITAPSYYNNVEVRADNQLIGTLNNGRLSVQLPVGIHFFSMASPNGKKSATGTIVANNYITWQVQ